MANRPSLVDFRPPLCSTVLLVHPRLWGGAAAVGFNKSIVFGNCLKGLGFILECCRCCCRGGGGREGYCAGTWGRLGSVSQRGPPRTGAYCAIVSIYNAIVRVYVCACVCVYVCCVSRHHHHHLYISVSRSCPAGGRSPQKGTSTF